LIDRQLHEPVPSVELAGRNCPAGIDEVLRQATAKEPGERFPDVLAFAEAFRAALSGSPLPASHLPNRSSFRELANPYKGLRAFQEADAEDFFGREALVGAPAGPPEPFRRRLLHERQGPGERALPGGGGAERQRQVQRGPGRAAARPAQRRPARLEQWFMVELLPGPHPLEELEAALLRVAVNPPASLLEQFKEDRAACSRAVKRILPTDEGSNCS
jgi:hypothetical protein